MKRKKDNEKGSVLILVAVSLSVLLGMAGFALDFGLMASTRQDMQNAADAAALAAAADLNKGFSVVNASSNQYAGYNGYSTSNSTIDTSMDGDTVTVTISKPVHMGLSAVLTGQNVRNVAATATAEVTSIFGGRPYCLFAGEKIEDGGEGITINGNSVLIEGNIHSNSNINMPHATLGGGAVATAVNTTNPSSSGWNGGAIALDMPAVRPLKGEIMDMPYLVVFSSSVTKNSKTGFQELINESLNQYALKGGGSRYMSEGLFIYINGDLTFKGNNATAYNASFPITLYVTGDIDLNGCKLNSTSASPLVVITESGDITVNGGGADFKGILYAPKGDVTLNGNEAEYHGSIVAQNIYKNGGKIHVTYDDGADDYLPKTKVHLIR